MKIQWIIDTLKQSGVNSKGLVVSALENATIEDLKELNISITERINKKVMDDHNTKVNCCSICGNKLNPGKSNDDVCDICMCEYSEMVVKCFEE